MEAVTLSEKTRQRVVELARDWIGTPYHHQASLKGVGCDCVGLVGGVYRELYGQSLPTFNYSWDWGDSNGNEDILQVAEQYFEPLPPGEGLPGDVIGIRWNKLRVVKHVMILTENNQAIHAYNKSNITEIPLSKWWQNRVARVFRFPEEI